MLRHIIVTLKKVKNKEKILKAKNNTQGGRPDGSIVWYLLSHAGDVDSTPHLGRFHLLWGTVPVPHKHSARALQQEKPWQWEAHTPQWRVALLAATGESLHATTKTQCSQNNNNKV